MNLTVKRNTLILMLVLLFAIVLAAVKGPVDIPLGQILLRDNRQILLLRLSRILLAMITGSGLAAAGIAMQAILKNPLAEPYLLGTSSGAGLGAVVATILGAGAVFLPFAAFIGSVSSVILVYLIAKEGNRIPVQSLILSGVIVSIAMSGLIVFLVSVSAKEGLHGLMWWLWGSLEVYDAGFLFIVSAIVLAGIAAIFVFSQDMNAMSIGDEEAMHLGIKTETVKKILFLVTSLITASLVSISGVIGFVGLIIPHLMRFIVGPNHKTLIPASCLAAAAFMVLCDTLSRTMFAPIEIPIGVITATIGVPVFIVLLKTKQRIT